MPKPVEALRQMPTEHVKCRAWHHAWDLDGYISVQRKGRAKEYVVPLRCMRCPTTRTDVIRASNYELRRTYKYPDMYLITQLETWGGRREFNINILRELVTRASK